MNPHLSCISQLVNGATTNLNEVTILIIGVGGIGCQLLKCLCKQPVKEIHIIDMDTIELSNLNRQFLFQKQHKGQSKALVARNVILELNPHMKLEAHCNNIKDMPIRFFKKFDFLIMALDNIQARNYVNKVGVRLNLPILDAGTLAFKGNVRTIIPYRTKCYSCEPKSNQQQVYPVCTIRMRPEKPVHCVVWAKLLFQVIFGAQNEDNDLNDLKLLCQNENCDQMLDNLYNKNIEDLKNAKNDNNNNKIDTKYVDSIKKISKNLLAAELNQQLCQKYDKIEQLSIQIQIFKLMYKRLYKQKLTQGSVAFEKDDDNIISFISSAANMRMYCFSITQQSFNEIKNIAGNIIPAIASTNSIVSGLEIIQILKYSKKKYQLMKIYWIQNLHQKIITMKCEQPLQSCMVCSKRAKPIIIECNMRKYQLRSLVSWLNTKLTNITQYSINKGSKQLYNCQYLIQAVLSRSMFQICEQQEQIDLLVTDQNALRTICTIWMINNHDLSEEIIVQNQQRLNVQEQSLLSISKQPTKTCMDQQKCRHSNFITIQEDSPEIEIIQTIVKNKINGEVVDSVKKKIKKSE